MVELLNDQPRFNWDNYSVPEDDSLDTSDDDELWDALREQIKPVSVVIILGGMYAAHSTWIRREMIIAETREKPILGVKPWGNERMPSKVKEKADSVVGWQGSSVVEAIRDLSP